MTRAEDDNSRTAVSLVELLIVLTVIAVLIGLLLPAVVRVRAAAARTVDMNNLRELMLSTLQWTAKNSHRLPGCNSLGAVSPSFGFDRDHFAPGEMVETYAVPHEVWVYPDWPPPLPYGKPVERIIPKMFFSAADPSLQYYPYSYVRGDGDCSYNFNGVVFEGHRKYPEGVPDGTSNTVAYAEHYARCGGGAASNFAHYQGGGSLTSISRRSTFADIYYGDVVPVPAPAGGSAPSRPGATFQVMPHPSECDPAVPQAIHRAGLLTAMLDGSVRTASPGVSSAVFWGAITPDASDAAPGW